MPEPGDLIRNVAGVTHDHRPGDSPDLGLEEAIAVNVRNRRLLLGLSVSDLADRVGLSKAMLSKVENAQTSCSLSTLRRLSRGLDVPVTSLFRGADEERPAVFVPAGAGSRIIRAGSRQGHEYQLLGALGGEHQRLECLRVTLSEDSETYPLFQHPGTEFIFVLDGLMDYAHGREVYRLSPGDALQLDGEGPHGPVALLQLPIHFLSVIAFPERAARLTSDQPD